jgi:ubiquinone/menaquinone biosynthesis C-methylase UbiE
MKEMTSTKPTNLWDERYGAPDYAFGTEPNHFFKLQIDQIKPGKILMVAEGEGRNAVYAASKGWEVYAFDSSAEGRKKAMELAENKAVKIEYSLSDVEEVKYNENYFDAIGFIYIHLPEDRRKYLYNRMLNYLKPGGLLILECFSKDQLNYQSGGPKDVSMLLSEADLEKDFEGMEIIALKREVTFLQEGSYHQGEASVVRCMARKPLN